MKYLHENFSSIKFIYVEADFDTRLKRKEQVHDPLLAGRDVEGIKNHLIYEWEHFDIQQSRNFLENIGALMVNTSGYFDGELPSIKKTLASYLS